MRRNGTRKNYPEDNVNHSPAPKIIASNNPQKKRGQHPRNAGITFNRNEGGKMVRNLQATNTNDGKALYKAASQAKENLGLQKEDGIMLLADKGYHTGAELEACQKDQLLTHVAYKEQPGVKHIAHGFLAESFASDKQADSYTCPAGAVLTSLGTWHNKKGEANETSYRFKTYRTEACKTCPLRSQCTKLPKRIIQRSEYQDSVDINDNNIKQNPQYYKRRQAICEHPFGTVKRHWGYTHTLLKGLGKVNGEMNLIMLCYNFLRTKNILGFAGMLQQIQNWTPDYTGVTGAVKRRLTKLIGNQTKPSIFLNAVRLCFLKTFLMNPYELYMKLYKPIFR